MLQDRKFLLLGVIVLILIAAAVYYFWFWKPVPPEASFKEEYGITLTDYAGKEVRLSEFKREVLVVYMWASWCPYCSLEIENLARLKGAYGDDVQIIGVNRAESLADARTFTDALKGVEGITFLLDPADALYKSIDGYAMPETIFIDERGEVIFHQHGPIELSAVDAKIKELLQ